jgi:transcriptional regulator with XRE-family HTH domain
MIHKEVADLIRAKRKHKKMTMMELAAELGYTSPQFVSQFERGMAQIPLETIGKITVLLNIPEKTVVEMVMSDLERETKSLIRAGRQNDLL